MSRLTVRTNVGPPSHPIQAASVLIETSAGTFQFGVDNNGEPYVAADGVHRLGVVPSGANRINLSLVE
jgi:hypothetical protein